MNLYEQIREIIIDGDIEELKKLFCYKYITDDMINSALLNATDNGKLNIVKYILNNYSSKITYDAIESSLLQATIYNRINVVKHLESYRFIRKNTVIYKNTVIFNF